MFCYFQQYVSLNLRITETNTTLLIAIPITLQHLCKMSSSFGEVSGSHPSVSAVIEKHLKCRNCTSRMLELTQETNLPLPDH